MWCRGRLAGLVSTLYTFFDWLFMNQACLKRRDCNVTSHDGSQMACSAEIFICQGLLGAYHLIVSNGHTSLNQSVPTRYTFSSVASPDISKTWFTEVLDSFVQLYGYYRICNLITLSMVSYKDLCSSVHVSQVLLMAWRVGGNDTLLMPAIATTISTNSLVCRPQQRVEKFLLQACNTKIFICLGHLNKELSN